LELQASGFEYYLCQGGCTLGISLAGLLGFLKQAIKGDQLTILHANGVSECVFVLEDGVRTSVFEMRLKAMEKPSFVLSEDMEYPTEWIMIPSALQRICKDMKASVSDVSVVITNTGNLSFVGSGLFVCLFVCFVCLFVCLFGWVMVCLFVCLFLAMNFSDSYCVGHFGRIQMVCDHGVEMLRYSPCLLSFSRFVSCI
jgi:hypothetical protein